MKITLPEELIQVILLRLPLRNLLHLKRVCKSWLSLISDPQFAKSHFDLAAESTLKLLVRINNDSGSDVNFVNIEDGSAEPVYNLPNPKPNQIQKHECIPRVNVVGSCRGFLLLTTASYPFLYFLIWNPSTGLQKRFKKVWLKFSYVCGIGYDSSTDDYVVVMITLPRSQTSCTTEAYCFSSRTNSWNCTMITVPSTTNYTFVQDQFKHGLFLNGALHWLACSDYNDCKIIAFDLIEKSLSDIPLPPELERSTYYLRAMGGCLCLCVKAFETALPTEMWMMNQYKVHSSWTKTFVFSSHEFLPICFTKNGDIVGQDRTAVMRLGDTGTDEGELPEHRTFKLGGGGWVDFRYSLLNYGVHRESLLSLPCDFEKLEK
ncbi:hypothetical protein AAZX31_06G188400 [Glycine max]|nr:hypothetical protein JHK85_016173 [Glycine max]KAG5046400.1 hypothetical protein JHK86_015806 [Glycine max]KAG5148896.1 hypothetical protein JHK82_015777 [Glycine max]KAH1126723.1 hypothetical protein GYH30_015647 [Glycine max]KAH1246443.1 F-box/kelch-repeat protein [Glycine max]